MNSWARKTARIAQKEDYLDRVQRVYPSETRARTVSQTVDRICSTLFSMGEGGAQFKQWVKATFRYVPPEKFELSKSGVIFLSATESRLRDCANEKFGAGLRKRPDFVAKIGKRCVVGEAKFLSSEGGEQGGGFEDAVSVAAHPAGGAVKVSILDGIVWLESESGFYQFIQNSSINVFSALLLKEFLESF